MKQTKNIGMNRMLQRENISVILRLKQCGLVGFLEFPFFHAMRPCRRSICTMHFFFLIFIYKYCHSIVDRIDSHYMKMQCMENPRANYTAAFCITRNREFNFRYVFLRHSIFQSRLCH